MKNSSLSFDRNKFLANFHGIEDLAHDTILHFLKCYPNLLLPIESAIQKASFSELEISAHTLKGAVSNFFAEPARLLAWQLEVRGREKSLKDADAIFAKLKLELDSLCKELQKFIDSGAAA